MLLEPGPLRLVPDAEIPRRQFVATFEALAAIEAAQLEAAASGIGSHQNTMSSAPAPLEALRSGSDLAAAANEVASQVNQPLGVIVSVDSNAGGLEGDLGTILNELASDLNASVPNAPEIPPPPGGPGPPGGPDVPDPGQGPEPGPTPTPPPGDGGGGGGDYEGKGDPRIDEAARILRSIAADEGATMEASDPRLLVEKADGIDRYGGSLSAAAEAEFRPQYRRRGRG